MQKRKQRKYIKKAQYGPGVNPMRSDRTQVIRPVTSKIDSKKAGDKFLFPNGELVRDLTGQEVYFNDDYVKLHQDDIRRMDAIAESYTEGDNLTIKDSKYNLRHNQKSNKNVVADIVKAAKYSGVDPYDALAIAQRETGIGYNTETTYPNDIFSNHHGAYNGLTNDEYYDLQKPSEQIPTKTFNKYKTNLEKAQQYPFASEMNTIQELGVNRYNPGDPDYPNKVAKEREIIMAPENRGFRNFVDSVYTNTPKQQYGPGIKNTPSESTNIRRPYKVNSNKPLTDQEILRRLDHIEALDKEGNENHKWLNRSFIKNKYPEVSKVMDIPESDRSSYNARTNTIKTADKITYGKYNWADGSEDYVPSEDIAELAHVEQQKYNSELQMGLRIGGDILKEAIDNKTLNLYDAQLKTYDKKGSAENEAHTKIEPKIESNFINYLVEMRDGVNDRKNMNQKLGKKQFGGVSQTVKAEKGEIYKDVYGRIKKISNDAPSHDDTIVVMPDNTVQEVEKGEGGIIIPDSESMLSASFDQVKRGDRKNSEHENKVRFDKDDLEHLYNQLGIQPKEKGTHSPAKIFEYFRDARDKKRLKYLKTSKISGGDPIAKASMIANTQQAAKLADDNALYDAIYEVQESKKEYSGLNFEDMSYKNKQYGGIRPGSPAARLLSGNTKPNVNSAIKKEEDVKKFYNDYYASDEYDDRLGWFTRDTHVDPNSINIVRMNNYKEVGKEWNKTATPDQKLLPGYQVDAFAIPEKKTLYYNQNEKKSTLAHEISHLTEPKNVVEDQVSEFKVLSDGSQPQKMVDYIAEPTEQRARLFDIHYNAKQQSVNNIIKGEKFDKAKLNRMNGNSQLEELRSIHSDEQIIQMLNEIAYNEDEFNNNIVPAQFGKKQAGGANLKKLGSSLLSNHGMAGVKVKVGENAADSFYEEYYNSDEYKHRLKENGIRDVRTEAQYSLNNLHRTTAGVESAQQVEQKRGTPGVRGYANQRKAEIVISTGAPDPASTLIHEYSHTTEPRSTPAAVNRVGTTLDRQMATTPDGRKYQNYVAQPTEQRARLFQLHKKAQDGNINNIIEGEQFDQNKLNKLRGNPSLKELQMIHTDEQIIQLLNEVAQNEGEQQYDVMPAQYGGIPVSKDGMYKYPNQPVIVPTNNTGSITMQNVNYPVFGVTENELIEMKPNKNYNFSENEVFEFPSSWKKSGNEKDGLILEHENIDNNFIKELKKRGYNVDIL